jgi:hypothetical protein
VHDFLGGCLTTTGTSAVAITTPTGAEFDAYFDPSELYVGQTYLFSICCLGTGSGAATLTAGASGITLVGDALVPIGTSTLFFCHRSGTNDWTFLTAANSA